MDGFEVYFKCKTNQNPPGYGNNKDTASVLGHLVILNWVSMIKMTYE